MNPDLSATTPNFSRYFRFELPAGDHCAPVERWVNMDSISFIDIRDPESEIVLHIGGGETLTLEGDDAARWASQLRDQSRLGS